MRWSLLSKSVIRADYTQIVKLLLNFGHPDEHTLFMRKFVAWKTI